MATEVEKKMIGTVPRSEFADTTISEVGFGNWIKKQNAAYAILQAEHDKVMESGTVQVGFLYQHQIADGYAVYRVESLKPLKLQHVPYMDGYRVPVATMRGLRLSDLEQQVRFDNIFRKAAAKQKASK